MRWSWKVGGLAGVALKVHAATGLLLLWLAASPLVLGPSAGATFGGVAFAAALVLGYLVHGAARLSLAAWLGKLPGSVTLLPTGAVADHDRGLTPREEWGLGLVGPTANILLAAGVAAAAASRGDPLWLGVPPFVGAPTLAQLVWAQLVVGAVNLLPALPLDGGRIVRSRLIPRVGETVALERAVALSEAIALGLAFAGLFVSPVLVFAALALWLGASEAGAGLRMKSVLHGTPASRALVREVRSLAPDEPLEHALSYVRSGFQHDFAVVDGDRLVGVLTQSKLLTGFAVLGRQAAVSEAMERSFTTVDADEPLERALVKLQAATLRCVPVVRANKLVGLLAFDGVGRFVARQSVTAPARTPAAEPRQLGRAAERPQPASS